MKKEHWLRIYQGRIGPWASLWVIILIAHQCGWPQSTVSAMIPRNVVLGYKKISKPRVCQRMS